MFIPLYDGVPLRHLKRPLATRALVGACLAGYLAPLFGLLPVSEPWLYAGFGLIPGVLFGTEALPEGLPFVPEPLTLATSLFLHGSVLHLLGNMLFLWVFGDNVEDATGSARFLLFYLACGIAAGLAHAWFTPDQTKPLIGASGAISGVVAAYLVLYPRVRLWGLFFAGIPLRLPAYLAIGMWIAVQVGAALLGGGDEAVGWFAHVGGLVAGALLIPLVRHRYDPAIARLRATDGGEPG